MASLLPDSQEKGQCSTYASSLMSLPVQCHCLRKKNRLEMWANAQRDGRPAEYRWRYCCLTGFFPIVDTCLSCEDIARQSCAMVPRWQLFGDFLRAVFSASRVQHVSDLHSKFTLGPHHMCGSTVDIQSPTAEIR